MAQLNRALRDNPAALKAWIKQQALDLGFSDMGVTTGDTADQLPRLHAYLQADHHGSMHYLADNLALRADPKVLIDNGKSILCFKMNYLTDAPVGRYIPEQPNTAVIARYARGRDYHKTLRQRLKRLTHIIQSEIGAFNSRPFTDSAPIFEKSLAEQCGLGWTGKHTLLIHPQQGSFFLLAELITDLALPPDNISQPSHCGSCTACIDICPTRAIIAPYQLDARLCIAYLTIEHKGSIAPALRPLIGNRVFGCDDCQLICPWNKFAQRTTLTDFNPRHGLELGNYAHLWQWDEATFLSHTEGSPLRRTGYIGFMRNLSIGIGNAPYSANLLALLPNKLGLSDMLDEHINWAIAQQLSKML